jgi:hypothetical protein
MRHFCTYFDRNYLPKGLALHASLLRHASPFTLHILCLDEATHSALSKLELPSVRLIEMADLENRHPELLAAKQNRNLVEYYFTCTPCLPLYVFGTTPGIDMVTYVDSDLYFYSAPEPLFQELGDQSILLIEHRFAAHPFLLQVLKGIYNVGLLIFRNDDMAVECLDWWKARCIEWCYNRTECFKYADQKYLDDWPRRFRQVVVSANHGAGLAGWNVTGSNLSAKGESVLVDENRLIFYHFSHIRPIGFRSFVPDLWPTGTLLKHVYAPYLRELGRAMRKAAGATPDGVASISKTKTSGSRLMVVGPLVCRIEGDNCLAVMGNTIRSLLGFSERDASK